MGFGEMIEAREFDRSLGMDYYATESPGCKGVLRQNTKDFLVEEIYEERDYEGGRYLVIEVEKENWDTHHLIRDISRRLKISQRRFGWAGTKDKNAITRQRMSIINLNEEALERVSFPGVNIKVLGKTNRAISLGDLLGNRFEVRMRDLAVNRELAAHRLAKITEEIENLGGLPNYFGVQRFGETRPVTHKVGEALVRGDIKKAVFIYLAQPFPGEPETTRKVRTSLWESGDLAEALKDYPFRLRYERAMLNHLMEKEGDYAHAFDVLALNLKRLFVHAYQSYIFNKILSKRMAAELPLDRAVAGDVVCFTSQGIPDPKRLQVVDESNLQAVNRLASRGRAYVTLPLFGHQSNFSEYLPGEIEREVMEEEGVAFQDFKVESNPDLGSPGLRRSALLKVEPSCEIEEDESALLKFSLPPGSYATVVLREYMKP